MLTEMPILFTRSVIIFKSHYFVLISNWNDKFYVAGTYSFCQFFMSFEAEQPELIIPSWGGGLPLTWRISIHHVPANKLTLSKLSNAILGWVISNYLIQDNYLFKNRFCVHILSCNWS